MEDIMMRSNGGYMEGTWRVMRSSESTAVPRLSLAHATECVDINTGQTGHESMQNAAIRGITGKRDSVSQGRARVSQGFDASSQGLRSDFAPPKHRQEYRLGLHLICVRYSALNRLFAAGLLVLSIE